MVLTANVKSIPADDHFMILNRHALELDDDRTDKRHFYIKKDSFFKKISDGC